MKCLNKNLKKQELKLKVENPDDLWYLSSIIDPGDLVKGRTIRKIRIGEDERKARIIKKPVFLKIQVVKSEFSSSLLRVSGKIVEGPDDVPKGSYHTFNVEENSIFTIIKDKWLKFQLGKIDDACSDKVARILIVVFDREEAFFAIMKKFGYELLTKISGDVQKKAVDEKKAATFYPELIKQIAQYDKRHNFQTIILASPSFFKEDLLKVLKNDDLKKKIIQATCSSVGNNGIDEVLKRDEVKQALAQDRISQEMKLVEQLLTEISKDNLAAYGLKETEAAANAGAITTLLITDKLIIKSREQEKFERLDQIMKLVDSLKAEIKIISSGHDGGKKLDGLGGIGAILRYKLNY